MTDEAREPEEKKMKIVPEADQEEVEEETTEIKEEEEEGEELEGMDESDIHPADRLLDCVKEILVQEKRLQNKNAGSIKYELQNNIYPLMRASLSAVIDYIDATESDKEEEEIEEQVQKAVRENVEIAIGNCKKLVRINEEFGEPILDLLTSELRDDYKSVVEWAKSSIEQTARVQ